MIDLVVGPALSDNPTKIQLDSFYDGISMFETHHFPLVVFNLVNKILNKTELIRLEALVLRKKTNCIFITHQPELVKLQEKDYVLVLKPEHQNLYLDDSIKELERRFDLKNRYLELSIQKRSIPFYILGCLLFLEPLIKTLYLKFDTGFDFKTVFSVVTSIEDPIKVLEFWALFPIAGLALIRPAATSLFVFASIQIYSLYSYITYEKFTWPFVQENPHISSSLLLGFNLALLAYFLIPENRKPYLFKTKELFRKHKRIACKLSGRVENTEIKILNLSETGLMFQADSEFTEGSNIIIEIDKIKLFGKIVRSFKFDSELNFGVQFSYPGKEVLELIDNLENQQLLSSVA